MSTVPSSGRRLLRLLLRMLTGVVALDLGGGAGLPEGLLMCGMLIVRGVRVLELWCVAKS